MYTEHEVHFFSLFVLINVQGQRKQNSLWFQSNTTIYIYFILTCFVPCTIIRPSLQNSE